MTLGQVWAAHLTQDLLTVNMLTELEIVEKIKQAFNKPKKLTVFFAITDKQEKPKFDLPQNKNLIWSEPCEGVYLINLPLMFMFKNSLTSINELFQDIVDAGFEVESQRFKVPSKTKLLDVAPITDKTSVAIVSMFSPKGFLNYWEQFLIDTELPENVAVDVVFADNAGSDKNEDWFISFKERISYKYNNIYRADLGTVKLDADDAYFYGVSNHAHVAKS